MRVSSLLLSFAVTLSVFTSCKKQPGIEVHETDYLNKSEHLIKAVAVDTQLPLNIFGLIHCDSLNIVLSQDPKGYVFVYSDDWKLLDVFIHQGRARNEFLERPGGIKKQVFKGDDGHLLLPLQDETCIKVLDITESLKSHKAVIAMTRDYLSYDFEPIMVDQFVARLRVDLDYVFIDNDIYHTLEYKHGFEFEFGKTDAKYKIRHDTTFIDIPKMFSDMLELTGPQPEDKFSRDIFKHPGRNLIIEPFHVMDYIMFYDLDNDKSFAVHLKGYPTFDDDPEEVPHFNDQGEIDFYQEARGCFGDAVVTDSYFMVFYFGGDYSMADENKDWPRPELLLFDWNGNFKNSVKLDTYIDCSSFDEKTKTLYGVPLNQEEETILSFDLAPLFTD